MPATRINGARPSDDTAAGDGSPRTAPERYLSKRELATHLGFTTRWIELRHHHGLPSRMIGGQRRYRLSEVEAWIERQRCV